MIDTKASTSLKGTERKKSTEILLKIRLHSIIPVGRRNEYMNISTTEPLNNTYNKHNGHE